MQSRFPSAGSLGSSIPVGDMAQHLRTAESILGLTPLNISPRIREIRAGEGTKDSNLKLETNAITAVVMRAAWAAVNQWVNKYPDSVGIYPIESPGDHKVESSYDDSTTSTMLQQKVREAQPEKRVTLIGPMVSNMIERRIQVCLREVMANKEDPLHGILMRLEQIMPQNHDTLATQLLALGDIDSRTPLSIANVVLNMHEGMNLYLSAYEVLRIKIKQYKGSHPGEAISPEDLKKPIHELQTLMEEMAKVNFGTFNLIGKALSPQGSYALEHKVFVMEKKGTEFSITLKPKVIELLAMYTKQADLRVFNKGTTGCPGMYVSTPDRSGVSVVRQSLELVNRIAGKFLLESFLD